MKMANHPRPGDIIQESLDELNVSLRKVTMSPASFR